MRVNLVLSSCNQILVNRTQRHFETFPLFRNKAIYVKALYLDVNLRSPVPYYELRSIEATCSVRRATAKSFWHPSTPRASCKAKPATCAFSYLSFYNVSGSREGHLTCQSYSHHCNDSLVQWNYPGRSPLEGKGRRNRLGSLQVNSLGNRFIF